MADILGDLGIARNLCVRATMPPLDTVDSLLSRAIAEITALRERRDDLLRSNNEFEQQHRDAVGHNKVLALRLKQHETALHNMTQQYIGLLSDVSPPAVIARPIADYHEDMGDVLWWKFPITEAPYVGTPNDLGFGYQIAAAIGMDPLREINGNVGGWPGDHTHFTPIPIPQEPKA